MGVWELWGEGWRTPDEGLASGEVEAGRGCGKDQVPMGAVDSKIYLWERERWVWGLGSHPNPMSITCEATADTSALLEELHLLSTA